MFNVSTDFLLGEVDVPGRLNYDISELGLSVQAARNLYTHKVNPQAVNALLENPEFATGAKKKQKEACIIREQSFFDTEKTEKCSMFIPHSFISIWQYVIT